LIQRLMVEFLDLLKALRAHDRIPFC
jgi:hypothetical protein